MDRRHLNLSDSQFPLRMYLVGVGERYPVRCAWCHVTCFRLLSQDGKYGKAPFPLPQQRKSLDRTHLLFCPSRTVTDTLWVGSQTHTMCSTRPCDIPSYHVPVPFMGHLHNVMFEQQLLCITWTTDVICLVVKGTVVVCPKDDVISLSLTLVFWKKCVSWPLGHDSKWKK